MRRGFQILFVLAIVLSLVGQLYAAVTNTRNVTISLSARDPDPGTGVAGYRLGETPVPWDPATATGPLEDLVIWLPWISITPVIGVQYTATTPYALSAGDGVKTVYIQYKDAAGNLSIISSTLITIDSMPPVGSILIANGAINISTPRVALALVGPNASKMRLSNDNRKWTAWEAFAASKQWVLSSGKGTKTVYVQFQDGAGNTSATFKDMIILTKG